MKSYLTPEDIQEIIQHVHKAEAKHPLFCRDIIATETTKETIKSLLKSARTLADEYETVWDVLNEEILEMLEAVVDGEIDKAIDESFDAIAVLIRNVQKLRSLKIQNKNLLPDGQK